MCIKDESTTQDTTDVIHTGSCGLQVPVRAGDYSAAIWLAHLWSPPVGVTWVLGEWWDWMWQRNSY